MPSHREAWGRSVQRSPKGSHAALAASTRCERQRTPAGRSARRAHPTQVGLPLRPSRPVERPAEQSRAAVFNRRDGAKNTARLEKYSEAKKCDERDRGKATGAFVALGPSIGNHPRRASSATRKVRVAGGVDGATHLPSATHWGMRCGVVGPAEASPASGGNPSRDHLRRSRARRRVHITQGLAVAR
jgi:hypothetical protein